MTPEHLILIANGRKMRPEIFTNTAPAGATIIAIDGGANQCRNLGVRPDYLIGDFDSIDPEIREIFPQAEFIHRLEQDLTDMEKALQFSLSLKPGNITIYSAFGDRTDHSAGNLVIFQNMETQIPVEIIDNFGKLIVLRPGLHRLKGNAGQTFSLFSYRPINNLKIAGFKYTIHPENIRDSFIGISNVFTGKPCSVSFDEGVLFLYRLLDND